MIRIGWRKDCCFVKGAPNRGVDAVVVTKHARIESVGLNDRRNRRDSKRVGGEV